MLLLGLCIGVFVLLACVYVHSTRVASLCILAAQSVVSSLAGLVEGPMARRFGPGGRSHALAIGVLSAFGMLIQFLLYLPGDKWYLPNGSAIPAPLRTIVSLPLELENALEEVRLACKCDFGRLHGYVAGAKATGAALTAVAEVGGGL